MDRHLYNRNGHKDGGYDARGVIDIGNRGDWWRGRDNAHHAKMRTPLPSGEHGTTNVHHHHDQGETTTGAIARLATAAHADRGPTAWTAPVPGATGAVGWREV